MRYQGKRQPRYRHRFLTRARMLSLQLPLLELPPPEPEPDLSCSWPVLLRGLCLKSASEVGASQDGERQACATFRQILGTSPASETQSSSSP